MITINKERFDTMKEAGDRLGISRQTLLRYLEDGFFTQPPRQKQGRSKYTRYFPESWYATNQPKLNDPVHSVVNGQNSADGPASTDAEENIVDEQKDEQKPDDKSAGSTAHKPPVGEDDPAT